MLDSYEAVNRIRDGLDPYGEGFSVHSDYHAPERQCIVEKGKTVGVRLTPKQCKVTVDFHRFDGLEVSMVVQEATWEACVASALETVSRLLKLNGQGPRPATPEKVIHYTWSLRSPVALCGGQPSPEDSMDSMCWRLPKEGGATCTACDAVLQQNITQLLAGMHTALESL